jgi:hypothetical protein
LNILSLRWTPKKVKCEKIVFYYTKKGNICRDYFIKTSRNW